MNHKFHKLIVHTAQFYGGGGEEATTQGPRFVTDIEKPILGVSQKRGENQPRFQVGSHFENCRVSKKKIITFSGYYKSIGSGFQVKVRGEKN